MDKCWYFCVQKQIRDFVSRFRFVCLILPSSLFAKKKDLCDPTLPFVKTIGPEVYKGEILIMLVSEVTVAVGASVFAVLPGMLVYLFP